MTSRQSQSSGMHEKQLAEPKPKWWPRIERILLLVTFLCTLCATWYSVRTARSALEQAERVTRPWIAIPSLNTSMVSDQMESEFEIANIGQLPAYVWIEVDAYVDDPAVPRDKSSISTSFLVLLPGQRIWRKTARIKGESYNRLKRGDPTPDTVLEIRVTYGTTRDEMGYFTWRKFGLDKEDLLKVIGGEQERSVWNLLDSDFK